MDLGEKCPITKQIDNMDETIKELNERIAKLEQKLKMLLPDSIERKALTQELIEIKKLVKTHDDRLKELRKHNKKSFLFCAILIFLIFLIYSAYVLLYGY